MHAHVHLDKELRLIGTNEKGHETYFDTSLKGGGLDSAASPMEIVLEAVAACTAMDAVPILRKQRKTVTDFSIGLRADRAEEHPKVFTTIEMDVRLVSPDATLRELCRAIELSQTKYCSVSTMLMRSGCKVSWRATLIGPHGNEETCTSSDGLQHDPQEQSSVLQLH